jgi:hypothetical protein
MSILNRYPYIIAFGKMMGHKDYYVKLILKQARAENAPKTSLYRRAVGTWCTLEECNKDVRRLVKKLLED